MKRSERLDVVQQVASRTERERAERVGAAERHLAEMQQKLAALEKYRGEYEAALSIGIDPKTLYEAGVEGALCSDETRGRLREIGEAYDWSAVGAEATA